MRVSVIMPFLNAEAYLSEAIESVIQQTEAAWELLLVDDGSTDSSSAIAAEYAKRHHSIRVLSYPKGGNRGSSAARNFALAQVTTPLLAFLDADDVWLPHTLQCQLELLDAHPEVAMVYANAERWLEHNLPYDPQVGSLGTNFLPPLLPPSVSPGLLQPPQLLEVFLTDESMTPCTCTVVVRTERPSSRRF